MLSFFVSFFLTTMTKNKKRMKMNEFQINNNFLIIQNFRVISQKVKFTPV